MPIGQLDRSLAKSLLKYCGFVVVAMTLCFSSHVNAQYQARHQAAGNARNAQTQSVGRQSASRQSASRHPQHIPNNMIRSETLAAGSSSKKLRDQVARQIPINKIAPEQRAKVAAVLKKTSVYRRLPVTAINTDPDLYLFLVRYPETILSIWQIMGVTQMSADRVSPFKMNFDDGVGTDGDVELVYGTPNVNIYYGEGIYEGPLLFRKVAGQCVLVLQTEYHRDAEGNPLATSTLDVFLKIDHLTAGLIAKTVHPLIGSTADHNFTESLKFVEKLSTATQENGPGVHGLAQRLQRMHPDVQKRFRGIIDVVSQRAAARARTLQAEELGVFPARSASFKR